MQIFLVQSGEAKRVSHCPSSSCKEAELLFVLTTWLAAWYLGGHGGREVGELQEKSISQNVLPGWALPQGLPRVWEQQRTNQVKQVALPESLLRFKEAQKCFLMSQSLS